MQSGLKKSLLVAGALLLVPAATLLLAGSRGEAPGVLLTPALDPADDGNELRAVSPAAKPTTSPSVELAAWPNATATLSRAEAEPVFERPQSERDYWVELEALEREDKQRALAYALAGEDWYGEVGKPAEARRAKIVTLLVDTGNLAEARERTRAFITRYPRSSYRRLVQGVTGIHPRPGAPGGR